MAQYNPIQAIMILHGMEILFLYHGLFQNLTVSAAAINNTVNCPNSTPALNPSKADKNLPSGKRKLVNAPAKPIP